MEIYDPRLKYFWNQILSNELGKANYATMQYQPLESSPIVFQAEQQNTKSNKNQNKNNKKSKIQKNTTNKSSNQTQENIYNQDYSQNYTSYINPQSDKNIEQLLKILNYNYKQENEDDEDFIISESNVKPIVGYQNLGLQNPGIFVTYIPVEVKTQDLKIKPKRYNIYGNE